MSAFGGLELTNRGRNLLSKGQTGTEINFTKISVGDGQLGSTPILDLNNLISEVMTLDISKLRTLDQGRAVVGTVLSNQDISEGFYYRELGLFANDPDQGEILYCYGNAGGLAEYIPPGGQDIIEKNIDIRISIGNAENITAEIDESLIFQSVDLKNQPDGYAGLDENGQVPSDQLGNAPDPDLTGYAQTSDVGENSDLDTEDTSTIVAALNEVRQDGVTHKDEYATDAHNIGNITNLQQSLDDKENTLDANQKRAVFVGTTEPDNTLGNDGDLYFQYEDD